jgi:AcrR family transcriptional regulator
MAGANLRDVAAEAGLTTGSLTHYFADKRELLLFTLNASLDKRRAHRPRSDTGDALEDLRELLDGVLPIDDEVRLHWVVTLAFAAQASGDDELAAVQRDEYRRFRRTVRVLLDRSVSAHQLRADLDVDQEAEWLIAVVDGIAVQALFDPEGWPSDHQRAHLTRAIDALR